MTDRALLPEHDADVPAFWQALDLPGLLDVHVHFLPKPIMDRVWQHFAERGPLIGLDWPITYTWPDERRVDHLRSMGVRRWTALPYAHKPGVAQFLNTWAADFADQHADCWHSATFYPEPSATDDVAAALEREVDVFKIHVQVGDFDLGDPQLADAWRLVEESGRPVVIHAGSGPVPNRHTGPGPVAELLRRHPQLTAVIAHAGAPEYAEFLDLAERFERVHLDTTMVFTPFFEAIAAYPHDLLPRLQALGLDGKLLLGSDFPNLPYPYAEQLASLARLDLGDAWLRAVCWDNPAALFSVDATV
jgi:predicted TIM-barrel fold metal-dependent hydrolase